MSRPIRHVPWVPLPLPAYQPTGRALSIVERLVLAVFLDAWGRDSLDTFRVSVAQLCTETGATRRPVQYALRSLEADGLLVAVVKSKGGCGRWSTYRLGLDVTALVERRSRTKPRASSAVSAGAKPRSETALQKRTHTERDPDREPLRGARSEGWIHDDEPSGLEGGERV